MAVCCLAAGPVGGSGSRVAAPAPASWESRERAGWSAAAEAGPPGVATDLDGPYGDDGLGGWGPVLLGGASGGSRPEWPPAGAGFPAHALQAFLLDGLEPRGAGLWGESLAPGAGVGGPGQQSFARRTEARKPRTRVHLDAGVDVVGEGWLEHLSEPIAIPSVQQVLHFHVIVPSPVPASQL